MSQDHARGPAQPPDAYPPAPPPGARGGAFGLGLAGTILGCIALLWLIALTALVLVGVSPALGWTAYGDDTVEVEGEPEAYEPPPLAGSLGAPGPSGYAAAAVSAAVNEALGDYYGIPVDCPAVPSAMANDLAGRTVACTATDSDWTFTVLVVFSDDSGSFRVAASY